MSFADNRNIRLLGGLVSLFFLSIPLAVRTVGASTPVPTRLEVSEAVVSELDSYVNSFFESVKNGTIKEYTEKADYIFEFVIKNMDAVDDPALLVEIVGSVANTLEEYSPNAGVDYMTALREALPPLAIEGWKFDYVMTAAKCEVYEILIRREIDKFEGTPNVKKPTQELAKLAKENEYAAFVAHGLAELLKSRDSDASLILYDAMLSFINKTPDAYPNWKMRVECEIDGSVAEKLEKEMRDEKPGLDELRKKISAANALSGDNQSYGTHLDRVLGLGVLQRRVYHAESMDKTISHKQAMELQKEIASVLMRETLLMAGALGGLSETNGYLLENALHTALALDDGVGLLDAYKTIITTCGDRRLRSIARRYAVDGLIMQMKEAKDAAAKLQVVQTLRDFMATDNLFVMSAPDFFQKVDGADVGLVFPLFKEYLTSLQGTNDLVVNFIVAKGVKWHNDNSMTMKQRDRRRSRGEELREEYETLGYILQIKEAMYEGDTQKAEMLVERFENVSDLSGYFKKKLPQVKGLIKSPETETKAAPPAI